MSKKLAGLGNKLRSIVKGGFLHILTGNILNKAIAMISSIAIARIVDKVDYAYLSYADNLYSYLGLVMGLGLPSALIIRCMHGDEYREKNKAYLKYAVTRGCGFDFIASIFLCVIVFFADIPFPQARFYVFVLCLSPFLSCIITTLQCFLRTQFKNKQYASAGVIQSTAVCVFGIGFAIWLGAKGLVIARYAAVLIAFAYIWKHVKPDLPKSDNVYLMTNDEKKSFLRLALTLVAANLFSGMMPINETFLVNQLIRNEVSTSNFRVAGQFPQLLFLIAGSIMVYYYPIVAQLRDWREIRRKIYSIGIFCFVFVGLAAVIGVVLTPWTLKVLYGTKYLDAIPITYVLWGMRAMNACVRMVPINMFPAIGYAKFNVYMSLVSCVIQTALDYWFITTIGITGVAWGATIVYGISGIVYWIYFESICRKHIKIIEIGVNDEN